MDRESTELNITFLFLLALVLYFAVVAIPHHPVDDTAHHAVAQEEPHTEAVAQDHGDAADGTHAAEAKPAGDDHAQPAAAEASVAQTAPETKKAKPAAADEAVLEADGYNIIAMKNPIYPKHKKGIVMFTHQKHIVDYAIECGTCHHDDKGQPLALKEGDPVQSCAECHKETQKPKGEKLSKKEKINKYHMEALHASCIPCHKAYNIEKGDPKGKKPAPTACTACHPKTK